MVFVLIAKYLLLTGCNARATVYMANEVKYLVEGKYNKVRSLCNITQLGQTKLDKKYDAEVYKHLLCRQGEVYKI
jgi:hypothetical protein